MGSSGMRESAGTGSISPYNQPGQLPAGIFLEFEAAFQFAQVYVNGSLMGTHRGGYTGFYFDITSAVTPGDNVIAIQVTAHGTPKSPARG